MAHDATKVIVTGLQRLSQQKPDLDRGALDRVLRDRNFEIEGMTGKVRFNEDGIREMDYNNPDNRFLILQIRDGKFVTVP
jgi:branched-chain amino acid transport system substrate-binding protein